MLAFHYPYVRRVQYFDCPIISLILAAKIAIMKQFAAREAKNRFGQLLDAAQRTPVQVTRKGRAVGVMMSVQHYENLRGAAWDRLLATMDCMSEEAFVNGMNDAKLVTLLLDES